MTDSVLSPAEETIMAEAFKASLLRAADVIDGITKSDVEDVQLALFREGVTLDKLHRVDRAMLASAHLRSCAMKGSLAQATTEDIKRLLRL